MELTTEERLALAKNRIRRAYSTYREAKIIIEQELWHAAANRLYYACYYITSGLQIYNNHHASTHAGVIRLLGMNYVATGLISKEMGKFYSQLFELRQTGDYDDWRYLTAEDIVPLQPDVEEYLSMLIAFFDFDTSALTKEGY